MRFGNPQERFTSTQMFRTYDRKSYRCSIRRKTASATGHEKVGRDHYHCLVCATFRLARRSSPTTPSRPWRGSPLKAAPSPPPSARMGEISPKADKGRDSTTYRSRIEPVNLVAPDVRRGFCPATSSPRWLRLLARGSWVASTPFWRA